MLRFSLEGAQGALTEITWQLSSSSYSNSFEVIIPCPLELMHVLDDFFSTDYFVTPGQDGKYAVI